MGTYQLYTDGACRKGGCGAWAYAILDSKETLLESNAELVECTTNNRTELLAVINGLRRFDSKKVGQVEVVCDSAYVVNCFLQQWYVGWRNRGWKASSGLEVKNRDLWEELLELSSTFDQRLKWTHVRGHNGNVWNEYVDTLCGQQFMKGVAN